jgi:single-strand DNA-binding protein
MMHCFSYTILVGLLVRDPIYRALEEKRSVCDLRVAIDGNSAVGPITSSKATYVDVTLWNRLAEHASKVLKAGDFVLIVGRLRSDAWSAKDGTPRAKLRVVATSIRHLGVASTRSAGQTRSDEY